MVGSPSTIHSASARPAPGANSMRNFYIEQSSNRYTVHGDVTDWVPVPGDAASYDDDFNSPLGGNQVWYFLDDSIDGWYAAQVAAGKTPDEINEYLSGFDVWDRYDYNGNGKIDAADYNVWRDTLGLPGTGLAADGNANGWASPGRAAKPCRWPSARGIIWSPHCRWRYLQLLSVMGGPYTGQELSALSATARVRLSTR